MKTFLLTYFLFLLFLLSFFSSGIMESQDGLQYLGVARNIYYTSQPTAPPNEYDERKNIPLSTFKARNGKWYSYTGLGYSISLLPATAATDFFYKLYQTHPTDHFPLQSDWLIMLISSFTNCFWAAGLGVLLFLYLLKLRLNKRQALFISFITIFTTNLFALSKESFAHMMFIDFMVASFLLLKEYSLTHNKPYIYLSGVSFGIAAITYNQTFILFIPAYILYYYLVIRPKINLPVLKKNLVDIALFLLGILPFFIIYVWYENLRARPTSNAATAGFFVYYGVNTLIKTPVGVFIEGVYGQLFSSGRSIFLYSPSLLIIPIFWKSLRKNIKPELSAFILLSVTYIIFYATQYSLGTPQQGYASLWHGESSWGPRYLSPLIPFGMLIVGSIYLHLSKQAKMFVLYPLLVIGLYIELLGVLMPYQIKFDGLEDHFFVNSTEYTSYLYSNLLPRYSPIFEMSKHLIQDIAMLPKTLEHGSDNVRFYDGIGFPVSIGPYIWRTIDQTGYISFDSNKSNLVKTISLNLVNQPIKDSSSSAKLYFSLNGKQIINPEISLRKGEERLVNLNLENIGLLPQNNQLKILVTFQDPSIATQSSQVVVLQEFDINNQPINIESLDYPYVSQLGPSMAGVHYQTYGGTNQDPWKVWDIHTQIYERTFDFWWLKPLYYWDLPKTFFLILFILDILGIAYFGYLVLWGQNNKIK